MNATKARTALETTAADWATWLADQGITDSEAMTAYLVGDLLADRSVALSGHRVYCAIGREGLAAYVGQTRRPLAQRIAGHARKGNAASWSWIISVNVAEMSAVEVDRLERSAHKWMLPLSRRLGRRTPAAR